MSILALLAILLLPLSAFSQTVYFRATGETGNLSEWTAGGGGQCYWTGPPEENNSTRCGPVQEQAHTGSWAFKLDLPNPAKGYGVKLERWDYEGTHGIQHGETLYFSAWLYIGNGFTFNASRWMNLMQWKTNNPATRQFQAALFLGIRYSGGVRQIYMDHWSCHIPKTTQCLTFSGTNGSSGIYTQVNPKPLPFQRWFHLEARYTAARSNGRLTVWQDGVQIFDFTGANFNTWDSYSTTHSELTFNVNNYIDPNVTGDQLLYADDIYITNYQVGTSGNGCSPVTVTFDNPAPPGAPGSYLNGAFQSINFGTNQWRWWGPYGLDPSNHIDIESPSGRSATFTFTPVPRILRSLLLWTLVNGTVTLTDDRGQQYLAPINTGAVYTVNTGWTLPSTTVRVDFTAGWALNMDNIAYGCP